jgi:hypothetical protein
VHLANWICSELSGLIREAVTHSVASQQKICPRLLFVEYRHIILSRLVGLALWISAVPGTAHALLWTSRRSISVGFPCTSSTLHPFQLYRSSQSSCGCCMTTMEGAVNRTCLPVSGPKLRWLAGRPGFTQSAKGAKVKMEIVFGQFSPISSRSYMYSSSCTAARR